MKPRAVLAATATIALGAFCTIASLVSLRAQTSTQAVQHPSGSYASVNGFKLWYETEGRGEPLVLVSGGPGDPHTVFHPFFSRLADRQQVVYFDEFGVGNSDRAKSSQEYSFARDIENLEGLRKTLGLAKMNLLGQSYGGPGLCAEIPAVGRAAHSPGLVLQRTDVASQQRQLEP
jgi:proline iminopeptidase